MNMTYQQEIQELRARIVELERELATRRPVSLSRKDLESKRSDLPAASELIQALESERRSRLSLSSKVGHLLDRLKEAEWLLEHADDSDFSYATQFEHLRHDWKTRRDAWLEGVNRE
jgi:hypothetical protein